jgi:branched-chain amino acid transport system ATP-binding protein
MSQPALKVENMSVERSGATVVHDLSFELEEGHTLALLGANGAGKTTAVDGICGLAKKRSGRVYFGGEEITGKAPHEIARLGLVQVSQERDLFPQMTVHENLLLGQFARRRRSTTITEADVYESFPRLEERARQYAGSLSGGEQQMLAIGRALLSQPSVLLLDEPTSGLAPIIVEQVVQSILALAQRGLSLILVEQNIEVALRSTSRVMVLRRGEQVLDVAREQLGTGYRETLKELYV